MKSSKREILRVLSILENLSKMKVGERLVIASHIGTTTLLIESFKPSRRTQNRKEKLLEKELKTRKSFYVNVDIKKLAFVASVLKEDYSLPIEHKQGAVFNYLLTIAEEQWKNGSLGIQFEAYDDAEAYLSSLWGDGVISGEDFPYLSPVTVQSKLEKAREILALEEKEEGE